MIRKTIVGTLMCLFAAAAAQATDTYNPATRQLTIPTLAIGSGIYTNVVVTISGVVSGPAGTSPNGTMDSYDPFTGLLTVQSVQLGSKTYYNAVGTIGSLVSIGGVTGTDTYNGVALTIPSLQVVGGPVFTNAIVTVGTILSAGGGMPIARDSYDQTTQQLTIASIQLGSRVYTNAVVTVAGVVSEGSGYTVGGTLSGLSSGQQLTLVDNGSDYASLQSNGPFTFEDSIPFDGSYSVWIYNQPANQTCSVTNPAGSGVIANVSSVAVSCSPDNYTIGGTLSGLPPGQSITITDNVNDSLTLTSNGNFTFNNPVAFNGGYSAQITVPPANSQCTASSNYGAGVTANVNSIQVNCSPDNYTIGGTLTGLAATEQVTLYINNSYATTLYANGSFTFPTPLAYGSSYVVTVGSQPSTQVCTVNNGTGQNLAANYSGLQVNCSTETFTIGGNVTGLAAGAQVTLLDNGGDALTVTGNGAFTFATPIAYDNNYAVTIGTQPVGQVCSVGSNGTGSAVTGIVTSVAVTCGVPTYTDALNLFASSWATLELTKSLSDVANTYLVTEYGVFGQECNLGGTYAAAVSGSAYVESLNNCLMSPSAPASYPNSYAYTGSFSLTFDNSGCDDRPTIGTFYTLSATSQQAPLPGFTITGGGSFTYAVGTNITGTTCYQAPSGVVSYTGGGLSYEFGANGYYLNPATVALTVGSTQVSITEDDFTYSANGTGYTNTVSVFSTIQIPAVNGIAQYPGSGGYLVQNGNAASSCTTLTVTFTSATQLTLACDGNTYTKNWTDADLVAAFAALGP